MGAYPALLRTSLINKIMSVYLIFQSAGKFHGETFETQNQNACQ